jgi:hypothetical protein
MALLESSQGEFRAATDTVAVGYVHVSLRMHESFL